MILVTGGAGYVGSHFVLHQRASGREVLVLDSLVRGHREAVGDAPLAVGDITDRAFLDRVLTENPIEAVVHFAAFAYVGESVARPELYWRNNVGGTLTLLEAMAAHGVRRMVFSSSCATYGLPRQVPIDESHPQAPINPYGASKRACEEMLAAFDRAHGLRYVSLRYFNAAGSDEEGRIGESHDPETHVIPLALAAASGGPPLTILGTDYPTPDGTCIRDYVHVTDLAEAHARALAHLADGGTSDFINLGTGRGHSVREIVRACESVTGRTVAIQEGARREGDPPALVASPARAAARLGWTAAFTDIERTVASAWRWRRAHRY